MRSQPLAAAVTAGEPLQFLDDASSWTASASVRLTLLSLCSFLLHGYHPYSEDAAIYVATIEKRFHPSLFQTDAAFLDGHARLSLFSPILAGAMRLLPVPLEFTLLAAYLISMAAFLVACYLLACHIFKSTTARWGATLLAASGFTLPVAGTSLLLMDPYLTARSISTPISLFAIVACLDRCWKHSALCAILAFSVHPLMGAYLGCFLLILALVDDCRVRSAAILCAVIFLALGVISFATRTPITDAYREAVLSRSYYFLGRWQWYEVFGLIAPLMLMGTAALKCSLNSAAGKLSYSCLLLGSTAGLVSLSFVHPSHPDVMMRLQVLRSFHLVYSVGIVMLGGFVAWLVGSRRRSISIAILVVTAIALSALDRQAYLSSSHIEWPGIWPRNPWQQAFLWIRSNTPRGAVFTADANAFESPDEDSQGFRAMTQRSTLNDSKDEGVASLVPALAPVWRQRRDAAVALDQLSDEQRLARLQPYGVTWILLSTGASTSFACPYRNSLVMVCRLSRK